VTGPDGIADFGLVRPGQYLVNAETPTGEAMGDTTSFGMGFFEINGHLITLPPGQSLTQELVCPSPPQEAEISLAIDWPEEIRERPLWVVCEFTRHPREAGGHKWASSTNPPQFAVVDSAGAWMSPDMRGFGKGIASADSFFPKTESFHVDEEWRHFVKQSKTFVDMPGIYRVISAGPGGYARHESRVHVWLPKSAAISQLKWPAGRYALSRLAVGQDGKSTDPSLPDDLLHPEFQAAIEFGNGSEASDKLVYPDEDCARDSRRKRREVKADVAPFEAVPGRHNEWRLPIPPRLADILTEPEPAVPDSEEANPAGLPPIDAPRPASCAAPAMTPVTRGVVAPGIAPAPSRTSSRNR
jgi:hypothetical protein